MCRAKQSELAVLECLGQSSRPLRRALPPVIVPSKESLDAEDTSRPRRQVSRTEDIVDVLGVDRNFSSLSLKDLLEARDLYHWHLTSMANVVGTAVGLYYIRKSDPWPDERRSARALKEAPRHKDARTFAESEVRDYSWPCVLVLVDRWVDPSEFGTGESHVSPGNLVPKTLYMPDGRMVPVCVVKVDPQEPRHDVLPAWTWPKSVIGGGFPLISRTQGVDHIASVGGLVTDGHTVYALSPDRRGSRCRRCCAADGWRWGCPAASS
jgi:hypothetical protein